MNTHLLIDAIVQQTMVLIAQLGSTWSLDVWDGHPLQEEALSTLRRLRQEIESLRARIDAHNGSGSHQPNGIAERIVVYVGQNRLRG